jgi:hypothetical protein
MLPTIAFVGLGACAFSKPEVLAGCFTTRDHVIKDYVD